MGLGFGVWGLSCGGLCWMGLAVGETFESQTQPICSL